MEIVQLLNMKIKIRCMRELYRVIYNVVICFVLVVAFIAIFDIYGETLLSSVSATTMIVIHFHMLIGIKDRKKYLIYLSIFLFCCYLFLYFVEVNKWVFGFTLVFMQIMIISCLIVNDILGHDDKSQRRRRRRG